MDFAPPLVIDPLIAEARRRARRRYLLLLVAIAVVAVVAAFVSGTFRQSGAAPASAPPERLSNAVALGTLVSLDLRKGVGVFRISCGWHTKDWHATTRVQPGLYSVSLRGGRFNVEIVDPSGPPGNGVAHEENLATWERWDARPGWTASLYLGWASRTPYFSDGPTTDICGGVLG